MNRFVLGHSLLTIVASAFAAGYAVNDGESLAVLVLAVSALFNVTMATVNWRDK